MRLGGGFAGLWVGLDAFATLRPAMARPERTAVARGLWTGSSALLRALPGILPAFVIVALLACVLVPLPRIVVDLLLATSLAGAVLLLVASLAIRRTQDFLSFPTLLLLVTLYRLALNISTTRLILSEADAGQVIDAFAGFVVRDDMVVGGVIFLIITVVQYVVIARGSERVAEVAARFALDALPGHQAAIDADLRSGAISPREAAERRARLAEQSNFYGAMDGAIRFVKGDAIAGLAITTINIVGGLGIGMIRLGYSWEQSLAVFGRLTIGDGLMAQIPALLVSLAAGVLVSRVDRERSEVGARLDWLDPAMLLVPSGLLVALALVPRMPTLVFMTTAAGLVAGALLLAIRRERERIAAGEDHGSRITVFVGEDASVDLRRLGRALVPLRNRCRETLGIEIPPIDAAVEPGRDRDIVSVQLGERRLARSNCSATTVDDDILLLTFRAVMAQAATFLDLETIDRDIEAVRQRRPIVVQEALRAVATTDILWIARAFVRERVPLPPMEALLDTVAEGRLFRVASERPRWPELARQRLARYWVEPVVAGVERSGSRWLRPDPELEAILLDRVSVQDDEVVLTLDRSERQSWRILLQAQSPDDSSRPSALLTTPRARSAFAALVVGTTPHTPVLSTFELEEGGRQVPAATWLAPP